MRTISSKVYLFLIFSIALIAIFLIHSVSKATDSHPRILLSDQTIMDRLQDKEASNDPSWVAIKAACAAMSQLSSAGLPTSTTVTNFYIFVPAGPTPRGCCRQPGVVDSGSLGPFPLHAPLPSSLSPAFLALPPLNGRWSGNFPGIMRG
jgi:hypothetical protein